MDSPLSDIGYLCTKSSLEPPNHWLHIARKQVCDLFYDTLNPTKKERYIFWILNNYLLGIQPWTAGYSRYTVCSVNLSDYSWRPTTLFWSRLLVTAARPTLIVISLSLYRWSTSSCPAHRFVKGFQNFITVHHCHNHNEVRISAVYPLAPFWETK